MRTALTLALLGSRKLDSPYCHDAKIAVHL